MAAIEVSGLRKHYGPVTAVDGIDLVIEEGEVFALLGPNGAGKTTTVEILEGHRTATAGTCRVLGFDPATGGRPFRDRIGIVLQEQSLERELTVVEAIATYAAIYTRNLGVDEVIGIVGLEEKRNARIKTLSGGQKRRLELALGIVGDPDLIFLDEPTTGFDPSARRQAWELIDNLRSLGKTILLTTHYMDEAQNLADRVAVIAAGRIVAEGSPESIGGRHEGEATIVFVAPSQHRDGLPDIARRHINPDTGVVTITTGQPTEVVNAVTGWAVGLGIELPGLSISRPSLEEVYLQLTGEVEDG